MKLIAIVMGLVMVSGLASAKEVTAKIKIKGMTCAACVVAVKKALTASRGVRSANVSLDKGLATIVYNDSEITERQLREAIDKTGFIAEPKNPSGKTEGLDGRQHNQK